MKSYYFILNVSYQDFALYYQGKVQSIVVQTIDGIRIEFPVMHLRSYLTSSGISGKFRLQTKNNKFFSLEKIQG